MAGGPDVGKILTGIGLIALSAFMPGAVLGISSQAVGMYGAGLVLGGIYNWLAPRPKQVKQSAIGGALATERTEGKPIPIVYGRAWVTPTVISSTTRVTADNTTENDGGFFGIGAAYWTRYRSIATQNIVDALCEGPIKGFGSTKNTWINGIPLQNADGSTNYVGINGIYWRNGDAVQNLIPHPEPEREIEVNREIKASNPVIRRITTPNLNKIRIRMYWQSLSDDGNNPAQSKWKIFIKEGNGAFVLRYSGAIYGKSSGHEQIDTFSVGLAEYYEIKIVRDNPDPAPNNPDLLNTAIWRSISLVWDIKVRYNRTAICEWEFDIEKIGTQIERRYLVDGTICKIPTNATVNADGSLTYTGTWDGTFKLDWTCCPAWCQYDLISNGRYGLGVPESLLDKFAFYAASVYCNESIPDGYGNNEARFRLNVVISSREEAFDLIRKMSAVFNAMCYYAPGGAFLPVVDRPQPVTWLFSNANATFSYSSTPIRNRYNKVRVAYESDRSPGEIDAEPWEDATAIVKYGGINELKQDGWGITSRGQARRAANWLGYTSQRQTRAIVIRTGVQGAKAYPGQVARVADWLKTNTRLAGRIRAIADDRITFDGAIALPLGNHTLYLQYPDGSIVQRNIASLGDTDRVWQFSPNLATLPDTGSIWMVESTTNSPTEWRIVSVVEKSLYEFEITAIHQDNDKFNLVESLNFQLPNLPTVPPQPPIPPENLIVSQVGANLVISWAAPNPATYTASYQIQWQNSTLPPQNLTAITTSTLITGIVPDTYQIFVRAVDTLGNFSGWISGTIAVDAALMWQTIEVTI
jgi:predicted phage tail protein